MAKQQDMLAAAKRGSAALQETMTVTDLLARYRNRINNLLNNTIDIEQFMSTVAQEIGTVKHLDECSGESLIKAAMRCAQLGLKPGPEQHVHIIPFFNGNRRQYEATVIVGYRGLIYLAHKAMPDLVAVQPHAIYENDYLEYELGATPKLVHRPLIQGERGNLIAAYVVFKFKDGEVAWNLVDKKEVERHRAAGGTRKDSVWDGPNEVMMWLKTAVRAAMNYMPQRMIEGAKVLQNAARVEDAADVDLETGGVIDVEPSDASQDAPKSEKKDTTPKQVEAPKADPPAKAKPKPTPKPKTEDPINVESENADEELTLPFDEEVDERTLWFDDVGFDQNQRTVYTTLYDAGYENVDISKWLDSKAALDGQGILDADAASVMVGNGEEWIVKEFQEWARNQ